MVRLPHIARWGEIALLLACESVFGQSSQPATVVLVGWLTYNHTTAEAHFKDCRSNKVLVVWQSKQAVDELLMTARAASSAYTIAGNSTLVHATVAAAPVVSRKHCSITTYTDGCVALIKTIEIRKDNPGSTCNAPLR